MSMFFSNRRANYMVIDGDQEDEHLIPNIRNSHPPQMVFNSSEVTFEGDNPRSTDFTKSQRRWDHIEDIDQFFSLVYEYHRGNGFLCISLKHLFALFQFIFVVSISTFLIECVDYDVLFNNKNTTADGTVIYGKRHIGDAIIDQCPAHFHPLIVVTLLMATFFWVAHVLRVGYRLLQLFEIQKFYHNVLDITDNDLPNIPWREVVDRVCKAQPEFHLIVNQDEISVLDVYQRILRYKNYMIGLVDNDVLSLEISLPFIGKVDYLSSGLRLNLEWLFFRGPWAPWKGPYALKDEFKDPESLAAIAEQFEKTITYMGLANLIFFPFVFIYQVLFSFFSYADLVRRDPGVFGSRKYSNFGRLKLRHYNELDHELNYRLNRSYEYAVKYMDQFVPPLTEIVAKSVAFTCGSIFAIIFLLSAWDEDVLNIDHVITVMTVTGAIALLCRSFIGNENLVLCHNFLMKQVVANIHYAPSSWIKGSHSTEICTEFSRLFQLKVYFLLEELLSPLITPFILLFKLRPKAGVLVLFFYDHSRYVEGIGDVCEYSLMELPKDQEEPQGSSNLPPSQVFSYGKKKETAKVELSVLNFITQHPTWKPSNENEELIQKIKGLWTYEVEAILENDNITQSMQMGTSEKAIAASLIQSKKPVYTKEEGKEENKFAESAAAAISTSSLIQPMRESTILSAPVARYLPLNEQAKNEQLKALEMSMNALAITNLLKDKNLHSAQTNPFYGSNLPSTSQAPHRPTQSQLQSNIWEVADNSFIINESQYDEINEEPEEEEDHELLPPGGFNV